MMKKTINLKSAAALLAGLVLFACTPTPKVIELSVSDKSVAFDTAGGEQTVTITCNDAWTVTCAENWVTVSPKSGTDNGSIKISVSANDSFDVRSADVTVTAGDKSQTIKVNQAPQAPSLEIGPFSAIVAPEGDTIELRITSNVPWTLSIPESVSWVLADKKEGTGDATVNVTVLENLEREQRSAKVTVKETVGGSVKELEITQEMAPLSRRTDSLALVNLYTVTDGSSWKEDRVWDLTKPMDEWYGVTLNEAGRVSALKLLKGTITKEWQLMARLAELSELTDLRFVDCKVTGEIPEELFGLTHLTTFYLTNNFVSGTLSEKVGQLTELANLYIDQNPGLGGELPKAIGTLKKLVNLNIAKTSFSGTIPSEITGCESLKNFMAYSTQFSGEVPDFWDQLASLELVQLYDIPTLTGGLPASLGNCQKLKNIYMYNNNLTGNIPESWANLPSTMINVRIQDNKLSGVVPAGVQAHPCWSKWKPAQYILPQQKGYGLTLE